ncbi:MAG: fibronectin type III domain-containing protein [Thermoplasmata archaeon]
MGGSYLAMVPRDGVVDAVAGSSQGVTNSNALPSSSANCSQGNHTVVVNPGPGDMQNTLLQDFNTLGAAGGGTLELGPGVFHLDETLSLAKYGNTSIQGAGMGITILSLPSSPIGNFTADNGSKVGLFNATLGGPVNGITANLIQVGGAPIANFEMCDLTLDAEANSANEDWSGSLVIDSSGGVHHVYSDIAEVGFFGPSTTPNGIHLESSPSGIAPAVEYVIDHLVASNNTVPFENYQNFRGGPNFLNVGAIVNCTLDNVVGIGLVAFEVAPPLACLIENWNLRGHVLIDPSLGGTWGGTLFQNVTVEANETAAPNALGISVANGTSPGSSNFTGLRWVGDRFWGTVLNGVNMVDVENSTFYGGLNSTPAVFEGNTVTWASLTPQGLALPIRVEGTPVGGLSSVFTGNTFVFPNGTGNRDPLQLTVPQNTWWNDTVEIAGTTNGYVMSAPGLAIAAYSSFSQITYDSLGNGAPPDLVLFDIVGSPNSSDLGAVVGSLTRVYNDLPFFVPSTPNGLVGVAKGSTEIALSWNASTGTVTNYTIFAGTNASELTASYSAGDATDIVVSGLSPETTYYFAVQAWNVTWASGRSTPVNATTLPATGGAATSQWTTTDWLATVGAIAGASIAVVLSFLILRRRRTGANKETRDRPPP